MAQYSGVWTLGQVSQAVKAQNWTGIAPPVVEYLVVAGGGGAGNSGGGGGAGGLLAGQTSITQGTQCWVTVGGAAGSAAQPLGIGGVGGGGSSNTGYGGTGNNGTTNTGGGAGGGWGGNGGSGGSGIVIIRYPTIYKLATSTTGSPTQTTANGYYIYTFTASGSITF